jgi:hypothetical protein
VTIVPDARPVMTRDPLYLKIIIENTGRSDELILAPLSESVGLRIYVEFKPDAGKFELVRDAEYLFPQLPYEEDPLTLKKGARLVTYDRLFRNSDGDFIFRKHGVYKIYAEIALPKRKYLKSDVVAISVQARPAAEERLIEDKFKLLASAIQPREVSLENPADLDELRAIPKRLVGSNLRTVLAWRILLLEARYGSEDEKRVANRSLDRLERDSAFPEPCRDILVLLRAKLALDLDELDDAYRQLQKLKDDSAQRQQLEYLIAAARKKRQ